MLFAGPYIQFDIMQLILVALLDIGILCIFLLDRFIQDIDPVKNKKKQSTKGVPLQDLNSTSSGNVTTSPSTTSGASIAGVSST